MPADPRTLAETRAIDWLIRQRDPGFADWDGFADWLAEDPGHSAVYDAMASLDLDLDALPKSAPEPAKPAVVIIPHDAPRRPSRRAWFGGAIAAALVGAVSLSSLGLFGDANRIETAAGEHRTIALAGGSRIEINGGSVIELDKERPRFARLASGEAMFHVVHRDGDPFVVEAGASKIVDLGTAFNVVRRNRATSVAVSEGVVVYNPGKDNVRMNAGKAIDAHDDDKAPPAVRDVDVGSVGGWRTGLLVYNGTPLTIVAEDLKRTAGLDISVAPEAAGVSFRGALIVDKNRARTVADLAALSGTKAARQGDGWTLTR
ncbi:FecR family protein [Sphingopyxis macrogoltabida]|uniref:Iron dicitrate transport regulator FecR n=1 Tax=Sphingopyxis macrogoltabida TaxID=33050 RepID=A0AAC8Z041_SPHMC|nr:FecR domain-containing protein [Sphingopyxis macrogoltabida]ALJ13051.1 iron dicitrate transport regulator FecR [Sphingopyxis macrogoltabida]AMU89483.1 iron dicitrate transport regulator FecR [Sphingopyxis macrogoltabida]